MITARTKHDPELSSKIWKAFKPTLIEKHGHTGSVGKRGEDLALAHFGSDRFSDIKYAIAHEDCLNQLLGIDITLVYNDGSSVFIDVKTGSSSLYWTQLEGWFITLKSDWFKGVKKTEAIMQLGPKGDVYAYWSIDEMKEFLDRKMPSYAGQDIKLYRRHWPKFIVTNL